MLYLSLIIIYFSLFIQIFSQIRFNTTCDDSDTIYNSLTYNCDSPQCPNSKGQYVCYGDNPISIFTFNSSGRAISCKENQVVTEIDGDGNILNELVCADKEFSYDDVYDDGNYNYRTQINQVGTTLSFTVNILQGGNTLNIQLNNFNREYYRLSCINGRFEKSCDYIANLCTLSMYDYDNWPCRIITNLESDLNDFL